MNRMSYHLVQEQYVTAGAVRSLGVSSDGTVLCGSQANSPNLRRFRISSQSAESLPIFEEVGEVIVHDHWVTAVTSLGPRIVEACPDGVFVTGCHDSNIRVFHPQTQDQLLKLEGHSKGVISFSWTSLNKLLSGSWDGSARIWDLELGGACLMELLGHENGVSVLGLSGGAILTTSTGESVNGKPANFALRVWDAETGMQQGKAIEHHDGSIRDICAVKGLNQGFATASNDGSVRVYTVDEQSSGAPMHVADGSIISGSSSDRREGACIQPSDILPGSVLYHPVASDNSSTFVLRVTCLVANCGSDGTSGGVARIVSCDMDGGVMVSDPISGERNQLIEHPNTVWAVVAVPNTDGDFITGCQDGAIRLFSKNPSLTQTEACQTLQANFSEAVNEAKAKNSSGPSAEEIAKHPPWADRGTMNKSEGTVMVFNKEGKAIAAQYTSGNWIELGEVTGTAGSGKSDNEEVNGISYDHVMSVEMEGLGGTITTYRMGFNDAENPFIAAQRFLDQNGLDQNFHRQVADWIMERGGGSAAAPTIGDVTSGFSPSSSSSKGSGDVSIVPPAPPPGYSFPLRGYLGHGEVPPVDKLLAKINDLNSKQEPVAQVSSAQMDSVEALLQTLSATSMYHSSTIKLAQLSVPIHICDKWATKDVYPGFDLLRLVCLHPGGAAVLGASSSSGAIITKALALLEGGQSFTATPDATRLTCLKFLNNTFKSDEMRASLYLHGANGSTGHSALQRILGICQTQASSAAGMSKSMRSATCILIGNLIVASFASPEARSLLFNSPEYLETLMHTSYAALSQESNEDGKGSAENIFLLLNGIGTLATHQQLGADLIAKVKASSNGNTDSATVGDILAIVEASWRAKLSLAAEQGLDEIKALFKE